MPNMTSDAPDEDPSGVESLFQSVWETMAAFTLALASTFKVECSIPAPSHEVTFEGEESAQAVLTDILAKVSNVWEALADCLAAGSATSPTAPDVRALHATLSNFKADSRSGKSPASTPGTTVTVGQLGRFVNSELLSSSALPTGGWDLVIRRRRLCSVCTRCIRWEPPWWLVAINLPSRGPDT